MEVIENALIKLIKHWREQNIGAKGANIEDIKHVEMKLGVKLPLDFVEYFSKVNGMGDTYLTDSDKNGFTFYQVIDLDILEYSVEMEKYFPRDTTLIFFADFLQKSWSYGIALEKLDSSYKIFSYVDNNRLNIITNSLSEFIDLYISDSPSLYLF